MMGGIVIGIALEIVIGTVTERHQTMGEGTVRREIQTGQKVFGGHFVLVRKVKSKALVKIVSSSDIIQIAHLGLAAVGSKIHGEFPSEGRKLILLTGGVSALSIQFGRRIGALQSKNMRTTRCNSMEYMYV
jgi:hypothetical protein